MRPNKLSEKCLNILLNMTAGLLPENLTKEEVEILKRDFGDNWFEELGYKESEYNKPNLV